MVFVIVLTLLTSYAFIIGIVYNQTYRIMQQDAFAAPRFNFMGKVQNVIQIPSKLGRRRQVDTPIQFPQSNGSPGPPHRPFPLGRTAVAEQLPPLPHGVADDLLRYAVS